MKIAPSKAFWQRQAPFKRAALGSAAPSSLMALATLARIVEITCSLLTSSPSFQQSKSVTRAIIA